MPVLRQLLEGAGFENVDTYLQSGNVVLASDLAPSKLWAKLAGSALGVKATARNWTTVTALAEMAGAR
jgi:uncharacterized protein (DUF1697 family)